jgi:hypothetical protein
MQRRCLSSDPAEGDTAMVVNADGGRTPKRRRGGIVDRASDSLDSIPVAMTGHRAAVERASSSRQLLHDVFTIQKVGRTLSPRDVQVGVETTSGICSLKL